MFDAKASHRAWWRPATWQHNINPVMTADFLQDLCHTYVGLEHHITVGVNVALMSSAAFGKSSA